MDDGGGAAERVAPVIPLFGDLAGSPSEAAGAHSWVSGEDDAADGDGTRDSRDDDASAEEAVSLQDAAEIAERLLLRKLRAKAMSTSEARLVLRGAGADDAAIESIVDDFTQRGYLNDTVLAELVVRSGVERRGLGRAALARALAQRGIPRPIVDRALADLPDDDADRALEFARAKASSMMRLDREVAIRRLAGQLARRGFGAQALSAARQALDEAAQDMGVRFRG